MEYFRVIKGILFSSKFRGRFWGLGLRDSKGHRILESVRNAPELKHVGEWLRIEGPQEVSRLRVSQNSRT